VIHIRIVNGTWVRWCSLLTFSLDLMAITLICLVSLVARTRSRGVARSTDSEQIVGNSRRRAMDRWWPGGCRSGTGRESKQANGGSEYAAM